MKDMTCYKWIMVSPCAQWPRARWICAAVACVVVVAAAIVIASMMSKDDNKDAKKLQNQAIDGFDTMQIDNKAMSLMSVNDKSQFLFDTYYEDAKWGKKFHVGYEVYYKNKDGSYNMKKLDKNQIEKDVPKNRIIEMD